MMFLKITHGSENLKRIIQKNLSKTITTEDIVINYSAFESLLLNQSNARQIILIKDAFNVLFHFESGGFLVFVEQCTKS